MTRFAILSLVLFSLVACAPHTSFTKLTQADFTEVAKAKGVTLYRNNKDFLQVVQPSQGASLHLRLGPRTQSGTLVYVGRRDSRDWFREISAKNSHMFSLINSEFFDETDPTLARLAFSMKESGSLIEGYGDTVEYSGKKMLLVLDAKHYAIEPYDDLPDHLKKSAEQNGIVGLGIEAPTSADTAVGRTYVGIRMNGEIIVFSSPFSTREHAVEALRIFGVKKKNMMMLDGGPSAQLVYAGQLLVSSNNHPVPIPAIIEIDVGT